MIQKVSPHAVIESAEDQEGANSSPANDCKRSEDKGNLKGILMGPNDPTPDAPEDLDLDGNPYPDECETDEDKAGWDTFLENDAKFEGGAPGRGT